MAHTPLFLVAIGGYPGVGKTTVTQQLSAHFGAPQLSSDALKRAIKASPAAPQHADDVGWLTFDLLFALTDDFLQGGTSVILDMNLGKAFHWRFLDSVKVRYPTVRVLPVVLRCAKAICLERVAQRYAKDPSYDSPDAYLREPDLLALWDFLEDLERPDTYIADAARSPAIVAADITHYLTGSLAKASA